LNYNFARSEFIVSRLFAFRI